MTFAEFKELIINQIKATEDELLERFNLKPEDVNMHTFGGKELRRVDIDPIGDGKPIFGISIPIKVYIHIFPYDEPDNY